MRNSLLFLLICALATQTLVQGQIDSSVSGNQVHFSSTLTSSGTYLWNFGDGNETRTSSSSVSHYYAKSGQYLVSLSITSSSGKSSTYSKAITAPKNMSPIAIFEVKVDGLQVSLDGSSSYDPDGTIASYMWNFGDGSAPVTYLTAATTVVHKYPNIAKSYMITLIVTDNSGTRSTNSSKVTIIPLPVARFFYLPLGNKVSFNAALSTSISGHIQQYTWDFGDSTPQITTTASMINHFYSHADSWIVTLTVTNTFGQNSSVSSIIFSPFNWPPSCSFAITSVVDDLVTLDASKSFDIDGYIATYSWNFGDGNATNATNCIMKHSYKLGGNYQIGLTVQDNSGATTACSFKKVFVNTPPSVGFQVIYLPNDTCILDASNLTFDVDGSIVQIIWDFGDGSPRQQQANPSLPSPAHTYNHSGYYNLSVTAYDNLNASATVKKTIFVNTPPFPVIKLLNQVNDTITLDPSGSIDIDDYITRLLWDFNDTVSKNTSLADGTITYTYRLGGTYNVSLTAFDKWNASRVAYQSVTVNRPPVASFSIPYNVNDTISLNASLSYDIDGFVTGYMWDLGDGTIINRSTSALIDEYTYKWGGVYQIVLTVFDNMGANSTASASVLVDTPPVSAYNIVYNVNDTIILNASQSYDVDGYIVGLAWNFGDSTPVQTSSDNASLLVVNHTYTLGGFYSISLTTTDNQNVSTTFTQQVLVNIPPTPLYQIVSNINDSLTLLPTGSYDSDGVITQYIWDFGDGFVLTTASINTAAQHQYPERGWYNVSLTVIDNCNVNSTFTSSILVDIAPSANFVVVGVIDHWVVVNAEAYISSMKGLNSRDPDGQIQSITWNFGDGRSKNITNDTFSSQLYQYRKNISGTFMISLWATDNDNVTSLLARQSVFVDTPPFATFSLISNNDGWVWLNASNSSDVDGRVVWYCWNFNDSGSPLGRQCSNNSVIDYNFTTAGYHNISLYVVDDLGLNSSNIAQMRYVYTNMAPLVWFSIVNSSSTGTVTVQSTATDSYDYDGLIESYMWHWGDVSEPTITSNTNLSNSSYVTHTYSTSGFYNITLFVMDTMGAVGNLTLTTFVAIDANPTPASMNPGSSDFMKVLNKTIPSSKINKPPVPVITVWSDPNAQNQRQFHFNANSSYDVDGRIRGYLWLFGDGSNATFPTVYYTYTQGGTYQVTLYALDDGGVLAFRSMNLTVPYAPISQFSFIMSDILPLATGNNTRTVIFNASTSYVQRGQIISYQWAFGDNNSSLFNTNDSIICYNYTNPGLYNVSLTVIDNNGQNSSTRLSLVVPPKYLPSSTPDPPRLITGSLPTYTYLLNRQSGQYLTFSYDRTGLETQVFMQHNRSVWNLNDSASTTIASVIRVFRGWPSTQGYLLTSYNQSLYLGSENSSTVPAVGLNDQGSYWKFYLYSDGSYKIVNNNTGLILGVSLDNDSSLLLSENIDYPSNNML